MSLSETAGINREVPCAHCRLRKLKVFRPFDAEQIAFVQSLKIGELLIETGHELLSSGHDSAHLYTLYEGWAFRFRTLGDGRRQILSFILPGDFVGLQASLFEEMQHSVEVLTHSRFCVFQRDQLWALLEKQSETAYDLLWLAASEEAKLANALVSVGRRNAMEKIGWLLLHLYDRLKKLGMTDDRKMTLPITQQHVGDALGLSMVHANKSIRKLVEQHFIRWRGRTVEILDVDKLKEFASYDDSEAKVRPLI